MRQLETPAPANQVILQDAIQRDATTARRAALLHILSHERYLTRRQLITRVEQRLGKGIFGQCAWEDNFYRDMRLVKRAFQAAGQMLAYSRNPRRAGYYLVGQPAISVELANILHHSLAETDPRQIAIFRRLSPARRFQQGCAVSNTARETVAYLINQANPGLTPAEANREALARIYTP